MKTPQEKKRFSYRKDRRNTFGENGKASRKNIPRTKAHHIRAERHAQDRLLSGAPGVAGEDALTAVEASVRGTGPRQWRKSPDQPLGKVLARRAARKAMRGQH